MPRVQTVKTVLNAAGDVQAGLSVMIYNIGTAVPATVYQAKTGINTLAQPLSTDSNGGIPGWLEEGAYDISVSGGPVEEYHVVAGDTSDSTLWDHKTRHNTGGSDAISALDASVINAGTFPEARIGALAVTEGKIGALAVTEGKIASNAVVEAKIANDAVTSLKIPAQAIRGSHYKQGNGEIEMAYLSPTSVQMFSQTLIYAAGGGDSYYRGSHGTWLDMGEFMGTPYIGLPVLGGLTIQTRLMANFRTVLLGGGNVGIGIRTPDGVVTGDTGTYGAFSGYPQVDSGWVTAAPNLNGFFENRNDTGGGAHDLWVQSIWVFQRYTY